MAQELAVNPEEQVVLGEEIDQVRLITLNRPRQLNVISSKVVSLLADFLEKWEKDDNAQLVLFKASSHYSLKFQSDIYFTCLFPVVLCVWDGINQDWSFNCPVMDCQTFQVVRKVQAHSIGKCNPKCSRQSLSGPQPPVHTVSVVKSLLTCILFLIQGAGRAFSAGGDLKMFYDGRTSKDACLEVVYRMYWLCYHIHTYKKTQVSLVNGIAMGGGASLMVPMKFSVVTEKTVGTGSFFDVPMFKSLIVVFWSVFEFLDFFPS
ncbi:hypothetical protein Tsubulata_008278 [Turnera subulata]|uniref:3-hydroxyisobutyryl-CoA hydrolase n=1 Tax=Turnera subulata TaxID=218843 RepID=A0A9Q0FWU1_9ROSI|nr:hypothetical protein Tsubulata_008278 [Turnera subulata]